MNKMEKRCFAGLMVLVFILVMAQTGFAAGPSVLVSPGVAPIAAETQVVIMGSGFKPDQEVIVIFEDEYGALAELKQAKANERGSWATVWTLGRYTRRGIIKDGVYAIMAVDKDFNLITSAPVAFVDAYKDPKGWPEWAAAAGIKKMKKKKKKK